MTKTILGIHGGVSIGQHDPAATLIRGGKIVASIEEERLFRVKSPRGTLPIMAIAACLKEAGITMRDVDLVAHPGETYEDAPRRISAYLTHYFGHAPELLLVNHQTAHIASAYYASGYGEAMCLSYDAYGDKLSAALGTGRASELKITETRPFDNSLGMFYATITSFLGFKPAEDEYKIMGLAAIGKPTYDLSGFARPAADGYVVDESYMRNDPPPSSDYEPFYSQKLVDLLGEPRRVGEPLTRRHADIAASVQRTLEECACALITHLHRQTGLRSLCIAGGVGLNCSANMVIKDLPFIDRLFVQPAASDRGLSLGCALFAAAQLGIQVAPLEHVYYGPSYTSDAIRKALVLNGFDYVELSDPAATAAQLLEEGCIIGWWDGRSEFGPRALGHRSILADPRPAVMKDEINQRIKFREEFRPFAPSALEEHASELFDMDGPSPYMTMAFRVREEWKPRMGATTHVNGTARVQTVSKATAPQYHALISEFHRRTGVPSVLNTSFNVKGSPIVETPLDALATFAGCGLDAVILENFMVRKARKPRGEPLAKAAEF